jgi:DNA-directed RNA polymerase specialized sigma24 family protein
VISMNAEVERPKLRRYNSSRRPGDDQLREVLNVMAIEHQDRVRRVAASALRFEDQHLADDVAQDVWLSAWQYLLRGNEVPARPASFLSAMVRNQVRRHYNLARVRRECVTDPTSIALERICAELEAVA